MWVGACVITDNLPSQFRKSGRGDGSRLAILISTKRSRSAQNSTIVILHSITFEQFDPAYAAVAM
jgi:hypothetical protein